MVYAWGLWKTRHERLREKLYQEFREKHGPALREELNAELRQWFQEGRTWEEWLNRESQGNSSKPDKS